MNRKYTQAEIDWLRANYHVGSVQDTVNAFEKKFGYTPKRSGIQTLASKLGLKKDCTASNISWTGEHAEWAKSFIPGHNEAECKADFKRRFGRDLTDGQLAGAKVRMGVKSGTHGGRFEKGRHSGFVSEEHRRKFIEAGKATRYKPGNLSGFAEKHHHEIGYERISKDGYIEVKVGEGLQENSNDNFRAKHHVVWEEANGRPIPPGHHIVFADHDKRNLDPANLVAVPRSLWAIIINKKLQYHDAESLRTCMNVAKLTSAVYEARMAERECQKCGRTFKPRYPHQRTCDGCLERMRA